MSARLLRGLTLGVACAFVLGSAAAAAPIAFGNQVVGSDAEPHERAPLGAFARYCSESGEQTSLEDNETCRLLALALMEKEAEIDWEAAGYGEGAGDGSNPKPDSGPSIKKVAADSSFGDEIPGSLIFGIDAEAQTPNNVYGLLSLDLEHHWLLGYKAKWLAVTAECPPYPLLCAVQLAAWAAGVGPNPLELRGALIGAGYLAVEWANYAGETEEWRLGPGYPNGNEGVWDEAYFDSRMHILGTWCAFPTEHNPLGLVIGPCGYATNVWEQQPDSHPNSPSRDYVRLNAWTNGHGMDDHFVIPTSSDALELDIGGIDIIRY